MLNQIKHNLSPNMNHLLSNHSLVMQGLSTFNRLFLNSTCHKRLLKADGPDRMESFQFSPELDWKPN